MPNKIPVANAGNNLTVQLPVSEIKLDGTASNDPDGTIASYSWAKLSGPDPFTILNSNTATPSLNITQAGSYSFQLTVTDNKGATAKDSVQVTVNAPLNKAPVANAGADQTITLPLNSVTLSGSGTDADGTISSYSWKQISGSSTAVIVNAGSAGTIVNKLIEGVYQFELKVTDNKGATATAIVKVTVNAAPPVPETNITPTANAGEDQTITLPVNSVTLNGNGIDTDGTISSYSWKQISGPSGAVIVDNGSASTVVNGFIEGVYQFELKVTDNKGATATATVKVTVNAAPPVPETNIAPSANAGTDQVITLPAGNIILSGSGIDSDGSISTYSWKQISGPSTATIVNTTNITTAVNGLVEGNYEFELTVTDDDGATAKDVVQIHVNPASVASIAIYPNPVISQTTLTIDAGTHVNGQTSLTIYDMQGHVVYSEIFVRAQAKITKQMELGHLNSGIYVIRMISGSNVNLTGRLVKQ